MADATDPALSFLRSRPRRALDTEVLLLRRVGINTEPLRFELNDFSSSSSNVPKAIFVCCSLSYVRRLKRCTVRRWLMSLSSSSPYSRSNTPELLVDCDFDAPGITQPLPRRAPP